MWLDGYRAKSRCRSPTRDERMGQDLGFEPGLNRCEDGPRLWLVCLESPRYCMGVLHTPAPYKHNLTSILIKEIHRFSNSRSNKPTTQTLSEGEIFSNTFYVSP